MESIQSGQALLDKTWLQRSFGLLAATRARLDRDAGYAAQFRRTAHDLFSELWPADTPVDEAAYLAVIKDDIDRVPLDLLDDLVDALGRQAGPSDTAETPESAAARVLGGWLRTRAVEHRAAGAALQQARRLKQDHCDLFKDLLVDRPVSAHQIAVKTASNGARLDKLS